MKKHPVDEIAPGWKLAGTAMFCLALATPLVLISFQPGPLGRASQEQLARSGPFGGDSESAPGVSEPRAGRRLEFPGIFLAATADEGVETELGPLGKMIGENGKPVESEVGTVRRLILDAVAVDLESHGPVDVVERLTVPVSNCDEATDTPEGDLITNGAEIVGALRSLRGKLSGIMTASTPGLPVEALELSGLHVRLCPDSDRIAAVEIVPLKETADPKRGEELVSEKMRLPHLPGFDTGPEIPELTTGTSDRPVARVDDIRLTQPEGPAQGLPSITAAAAVSSPRAAPTTPGVPDRDEDRVTVSDAPTEVAVAGVPVQRDPTEGQDPASQLPAAVGQQAPATPSVVTDVESSVLLTLNGSAYLVANDMPVAPAGANRARDGISNRPPQHLGTVALNSSQPNGVIRVEDTTVEEDLRLDSKARWNAQLRLALLGHDPKGIDGVFGDGTRSAIAALQEREALPVTGFLDAETLDRLKERSQPAYLQWRADRRAKLALRKAQELEGFAPDQVARLPAERRAGHCSRDQRGGIIENQSFDCDVNILKESLSALFGRSG